MNLFQLRKIAFSFCLVFAVLNADAAGLGNLNLMSGLGEPLNADVDLLSVNDAELATIQATIASDQAYADQSLEKPPSHHSIKIEVTKNTKGEPVLKLQSTQPISDAFLDMLIQVEWPTGRLVKEYTVLLDPPSYEQKVATSPTVALPSSGSASEKTPDQIQVRDAIKAIEPKVDSSLAERVSKTNQSENKENRSQLSPEQLSREKAKIKYKFKDDPSKDGIQASHTTVIGDTLYAIARANQPEGISLEQMLIGLYQENPNAFINKNIHKLKVGQALTLPSQETLEKISPSEAKRQYKAQSAHWNTYKNKLAGLVKESKPSAEESRAQQRGGKVVAAEDKSLPVNTGVKDVVKLSAGDANVKDTKSNKSIDKSFQDKANALQEEITAKENAVNEALSRTADLEKQVSEMQKLLALKNDAMLKLQQNASAASKQMKSTEAGSSVASSNQDSTKTNEKSQTANANTEAVNRPAEVEQNTAVKSGAENPPSEVNSAPSPSPTDVANSHLPNKVEPPNIVTEEPIVEQTSFIRSLFNRLAAFSSALKLNSVSLTGLLAIPVLGGIWWGFRQKRKNNLASFEDGIVPTSASDMTVNTVFGNTKGGTVEAGDTSFLTDFSQSAVGGMIDANDVDPIAEAEVYMAYGRDAQAEEILKDAIAKEPNRYELHLKLLEIYQTSQNISAFEAIAGELYANLGGGDQNWLKVAQMGAKLDPNNPLYQSSGLVATPMTISDDSSDTISSAVLSSSPQVATTGQASTQSDYDMLDLNFETPALDFDIDKSASAEQKKANDALKPFGDTIAFGNAMTSFDTTGFDNSIIADPVSKSESIAQTNLTAPEGNNILAENTLSMDASDFLNTMTPKSLDLPTIDFVGGTEAEIKVDDAEAETISFASTAMSTNLDATEMFKSVPSLNFDVAEEGIPTKIELTEGLASSVVDVGNEMGLTTASEAVFNNPNEVSNTTEVSMTAEAAEEVETKLDLIKAYIDMEDVVGAKELIEEVLKEGTESHRKRANELLVQLK